MASYSHQVIFFAICVKNVTASEKVSNFGFGFVRSHTYIPNTVDDGLTVGIAPAAGDFSTRCISAEVTRVSDCCDAALRHKQHMGLFEPGLGCAASRFE